MKPAQLLTELENLFIKHADPSSAERQSAYLVNQFPFFGLPKPKRAMLQKELFNQIRSIKRPELIEIVKGLWEKPQREFHYAAIDLLTRHWKQLTPADLPFLEDIIRTHAWWDTVDALASNVLGKLLMQHPDLISQMDQWIVDEFLWIRRSALIFQLKWKEKTKEECLFDYCQKTMCEKNFFIRKGIGWALREYSKTKPKAVSEFLSEHAPKLSKLTYKEASRHLSQPS